MTVNDYNSLVYIADKRVKASVYRVEQDGNGITLYCKGRRIFMKLHHNYSDLKDKAIIDKLLNLYSISRVEELNKKDLWIFIDFPINKLVAYSKCEEPYGVDLLTGNSCYVVCKKRQVGPSKFVKKYAIYN